MKILHLISSVNPADGGPAEAVRQLGAANLRLGHQVEAVTLDTPGEVFTHNFPAPLHCLGPSRLNYRHSPKLVPWLCANHAKYDAIVVHGMWQFNSLAAYLALRNADTPYYVYPHGMLDSWFARAYPLKHLKKMIYWKLVQNRTVTAARALLFTCEEERVRAADSFRPYRRKEIVVHYGTATPKGSSDNLGEVFQARFPETRNKRCFLFIGRIHEKKGCDLLIRAFHQVAEKFCDLHLVIAGPNQSGLVSSLRGLGEKLGVGRRITWAGMIEGDLKWGALDVAEAFVLPSHQENFGIAVVEALARGVPVLISNQVNIWREIDQDGAGLVADDTQEGTNSLLERWLNLPEPDQEKIRAQTTHTFANRFEIHQAARSLIEAIAITK